MPRVCYAVAMSLDGYVAGPQGESDWIIMDPEIDFQALMSRFDAVLMGRKTYEVTRQQGGGAAMPGITAIVVSRTLRPQDHPDVTIISDNLTEAIGRLRQKPGKDIWLFGGGALFRTLLDAGLVDTVEIAVNPVLLGEGIPLLPPGASTKLVLSDKKILPASGIVVLAYSVPGTRGPAPRIRFIKSGNRGPKSARARAIKRARKNPAR